MAILARENDLEVDVVACDLTQSVIDRARRARYSEWSLRETAPDARRQWFQADGSELVLADSVRLAVRFEQRNLTVPDPVFFAPNAFDAIFCRNMIMYLVPELGKTLITRFARSLSPGGHLFLGHAETLRGMSGDFHLRHTHDSFYYQLRDTDGRGLVDPPLSWAEPSPLVAAVDLSASWVDAIRQSSERIDALVSSSPRDVAAPAVTARDWGMALDLLKHERFDEALRLVRELPAEAQRDTDAQLLVAVLLTNAGKLEEARAVCEALLARDELNAGAHYVMALCHEHSSERALAIEHDETAAYLDPGFAMPHLHLGLLHKRAKETAAAKRELGSALTLLGKEDGARLLLFGGGFSRDALLSLCRNELAACGAGE